MGNDEVDQVTVKDDPCPTCNGRGYLTEITGYSSKRLLDVLTDEQIEQMLDLLTNKKRYCECGHPPDKHKKVGSKVCMDVDCLCAAYVVAGPKWRSR